MHQTLPHPDARRFQTVDKLSPHNREAEEPAFGSLLLGRDAIIHVAATLKPEDFYRGADAAVYHAILDLYRRPESTDLLTVADITRDERGSWRVICGRADRWCANGAVLRQQALPRAPEGGATAPIAGARRRSLRRSRLGAGRRVARRGAETDAGDEPPSPDRSCHWRRTGGAYPQELDSIGPAARAKGSSLPSSVSRQVDSSPVVPVLAA